MHKVVLCLILLILVGCNYTVTAPKGYTIEWVPPTTRVWGTPLALSEIAGYELCVNTACEFIEDFNSHYLGILPKGVYAISMFTVDTDNLKSDRSDVIILEVN